ncbi:MAG: hypothetical protein LUQ01_02190 [Methanolinea sp.]|nr:hypothetical protein [Methanolinea sp.]
MAAASLIASAFGIILLILTAYFLAAGAVSTMEVVASAQKDMTQLQVKMLGTSIDFEVINATSPMHILAENTGREPIRDYSHMDVYIEYETDCARIPYWGSGGDYWYSDSISQWDPGEVRNLSVTYSGGTPKAVQIVTANGITARTIIT